VIKDEIDKHPWRTLAIMVPAGTLIFMGILFAIQMAVQAWGDAKLDPSIWNLYWFMGPAGAAFGFVLWWGYEQGDYNPFHGHS